MRYINITALVVFASAVLLFFVQNLSTVTVKYLSWELSIPLSAVAFGMYLLGMASGWGVLSFLKRSVRAAKKTDVATESR
jgi:putative membrane protein